MCVQLRDQINESKTDDFIRVHAKIQKKSVCVFAKSLLSVKNKQKFYERALTNTSLEPRPQPPIPCMYGKIIIFSLFLSHNLIALTVKSNV